MDGNSINNDRPPDDAIDSIDPLGQFPTENAQTPVTPLPTHVTSIAHSLIADRMTPASSEPDAVPLFAFVSEKAARDVRDVAPAAAQHAASCEPDDGAGHLVRPAGALFALWSACQWGVALIANGIQQCGTAFRRCLSYISYGATTAATTSRKTR